MRENKRAGGKENGRERRETREKIQRARQRERKRMRKGEKEKGRERERERKREIETKNLRDIVIPISPHPLHGRPAPLCLHLLHIMQQIRQGPKIDVKSKSYKEPNQVVSEM
jgi:hypothetical protein